MLSCWDGQRAGYDLLSLELTDEVVINKCNCNPSLVIGYCCGGKHEHTRHTRDKRGNTLNRWGQHTPRADP